MAEASPTNSSSGDVLVIRTPLTRMLGMRHPIILAGMNAVSGASLAAAVSNAGGLGVVGGLTYTPAMMRSVLTELKSKLTRPDLPFGVDLAIPQLGGSARKTNYDYTHGKLGELIDIVIEFKAALFVSAVGVPPRWAVDKLHAAGIPIMNMIGSVRHVRKALDAGVDILCPQGTEGGGHTGAVATTLLLPQVVDACRGAKAPIDGQQVKVVAAGGIADGRGLAAALILGADGVWVGTRFICAAEASAPKRHQDAVLSHGSEDTIVTTVYTGRPLRTLAIPYLKHFEEFRREDLRQAQASGVIAGVKDLTARAEAGDIPPLDERSPLLMGQAIGMITKVEPAAVIVDGMMRDAVLAMRESLNRIHKL